LRLEPTQTYTHTHTHTQTYTGVTIYVTLCHTHHILGGDDGSVKVWSSDVASGSARDEIATTSSRPAPSAKLTYSALPGRIQVFAPRICCVFVYIHRVLSAYVECICILRAVTYFSFTCMKAAFYSGSACMQNTFCICRLHSIRVLHVCRMHSVIAISSRAEPTSTLFSVFTCMYNAFCMQTTFYSSSACM